MRFAKFLRAGQAIAACLPILAAAATAQEAPPAGGEQKSVGVVRIGAPPVIDGILDDDAWRQAAVIDDLHQVQPTEYAAPSEPTVVYVAYDDDALYIGARLYDREPELIAARILRQGERVFGDDWFSVIIDPQYDRRSGYRFLTNPNGIRQEGLYQNVSDTEWEWQGIWQTAASIDADGWTAEMRIPFKSISFDPNSDTWGINFRRALARRDERMGWVSRNQDTDPSTSGIAVGFEGLKQGRGLDIVPSATARRREDRNPMSIPPVGPSTRTDLEPSVDVFYKITPSLTGSLTVNTDFSATEVDDRQVNLTRFSLFFPEKRDFFLQDADIFEFGRLDQNGRPFFSRRIGLSRASGEPVDLLYGGKLSGRVGRFNIGALAIRQDELGAVNRDNAVVTRVSANIMRESSIGMIATQGDVNSNLDNAVQGIDFNYRNTRLPGGRMVETNAWIQRSTSDVIVPAVIGDSIVSERGRAYGFGVRSPNSSGIRGGMRFAQIEADFNPALGFVNRRDIRQLNYGTEYTHRPREGYLRSIMTGINLQRVELISGPIESQRLTFRMIEAEARQGDELRFRVSRKREVLFERFEIHDDVFIEVGDYEFNDVNLNIETADHRRVWGDLDIRSGDFFNGERMQIGASISWRPSGRFFTELGYEYNDIDLPVLNGRFETRLLRMRLNLVFSAKLSWVNLIQYDNVSEIAGLNSRLHWVPVAGQEGFIVFNKNVQDFDGDNRFSALSSEASIKFSYTFRF